MGLPGAEFVESTGCKVALVLAVTDWHHASLPQHHESVLKSEDGTLYGNK